VNAKHDRREKTLPEPSSSSSAVPAAHRLQTDEIVPTVGYNSSGTAVIVDVGNFPVLQGVTSYLLEIFEDSMRLPHWHPNAYEIGLVKEGTIKVYLWRSTGEVAVFTVTKGSLWFIPIGALHSLNNVGKEPAVLLVGFSSENPGNVDLPVAFNGLPMPLRDAYTSPHAPLRNYMGPVMNPLSGFNPLSTEPQEPIFSPYSFDLKSAIPLFSNPMLGSVIWAVTENWPIIEDSGIAFLSVILKPETARDAIWWPDAAILYVVVRGGGYTVLVLPGFKPQKLKLKPNDMVFVPEGIMHSFVNTEDNDFELAAFFSNSSPLPEVSLGAATAFFPRSIANAALASYGNLMSEGQPLADMKHFEKPPYVLKVTSESCTISSDVA